VSKPRNEATILQCFGVFLALGAQILIQEVPLTSD